MKACWMAMLMLTLLFGTAKAERVTTTMKIGNQQVSIDAEIYGTEVEHVQTYEVTNLDLGNEPEKRFDLSLWFGKGKELEKRRYDAIVFLTEGEEVFWKKDCARFSPYGQLFLRATQWRLEAEAVYYPIEKWNRSVGERVEATPLEDFPIRAATEKIQPILTALGVEIQKEPVFAESFSVSDLEAATKAHREHGVSPDETLIEDWTKEDEYYELSYRQFFHGLPIMETDEHMPGIYEWETPRTVITAQVSRRGIEKLSLGFVPTEEKAVGEAFEPIPVRDALEACERLGSTEVYLEHAHVSEIRLGYVMLAEDRALTQAMARPAWLIRIWGEFEGESESQMIAIDARTGESMLD